MKKPKRPERLRTIQRRLEGLRELLPEIEKWCGDPELGELADWCANKLRAATNPVPTF